ncbi:MAG: GAF domain-containing protein [Deltaproteobacteria bacterium]|nr:GAF domain-containing protein [Deltaproteobacteria bacterium]
MTAIPTDVSKKGEEILNIVQKGAEFTHELLQENEKLRFRVAQLEEMNVKLGHGSQGGENEEAELKILREKLNSLEDERSKLLERYKAVEDENKDFANRYIDIETENNNLANLYVASYQLHSTLNFNEVIRIILEIIINLIGAERFAIMLLDEKTQMLSTVATEGVEIKDVPASKLGEGVIGKCGEVGENYFAENPGAQTEFNPALPIVCVPMKIKDRIIGVISIYSLLQQKEGFSKLDYELFTLLGGQTATAVFSAKLYSESERKLSTVQGFIDLLTK